ASWQPGTPGKKKTTAAQPPGYPPEPANGAAKPSPASPPGHPDRSRRDHAPRARHHQHSSHDQAKARPDTGQTRKPDPAAAPEDPGTGDHRLPEGMSDPNVKMVPTET